MIKFLFCLLVLTAKVSTHIQVCNVCKCVLDWADCRYSNPSLIAGFLLNNQGRMLNRGRLSLPGSVGPLLTNQFCQRLVGIQRLDLSPPACKYVLELRQNDQRCDAILQVIK